jgi:hypothetical protein
MKEFDEEKILANLFLNLKGPKKKRDNWIEIANNCKQLVDYYGSMSETAKKLGVNYEIVRSVLKLLTLPEEVKSLVRSNKILFDVGQRIARINDRETQIEVAKAVVGLTSHDARELIQYAKNNPNADLEDFKRRVITSKNRKEKLHLTIIPLKEETYSFLKKIGAKEQLSPEKLIQNVINQWIKNMKNGR